MGNRLSTFPKLMSMTKIKKADNDVNDSTQSRTGVPFGRQGNKASAVDIQRNKDKDKIYIGTWNVRTMRRAGKLANVIKEMRKAKLDILRLAEARWKDGGETL